MTVAIGVIALLLPSGDQWTGFLGANQRSVKADSIPVKWSPDSVAWKAKTPGHGQSSPVIWGNLVVVTSVEGPKKDTLHVIGFDLSNGDKRWQFEMPTSDPVENSDYVSRAAPTPVIDGKLVYAYFESGDVIALDHQGKKVWHRSLAKDYGKFQNEFGLGASPVLVDGKLVILVDDKGPSYIIALNANDGSNAWKTDRKPRQSWSSPAVVTVGGKPQIVCSSAGSVDGYDPATGKQLWTMSEVGGNTAATPIPYADGKFLIAGSAGQRGENAEAAKTSNAAMVIESKPDGSFVPRKLWIAQGVALSWASPFVYQGYAYWVNRVGNVWCINAENGEEMYSERAGDSCWATPVGIGDRIYFFGRSGKTTVIAAGPKFQKIATNSLWEPEAQKPAEKKTKQKGPPLGTVLYGVAIVDGAIVARNGDTVFCIRK